MLAYHKDVLKRSRRYKLVQATDIMNIDDVMASAQARLPEGLTLEKKTEGKYTQLWLRVRPQLGMTLIFR